jgi:heme exporter protein A
MNPLPQMMVHFGLSTSLREWDPHGRRARAQNLRAPLGERPDARAGYARGAADRRHRTFLKRRVVGWRGPRIRNPLNKPLRLEIVDVALSRGERRLCAGLSFAVESGEALVVTGPNGVGKTTLLRAAAGFVPLDAGEIRLVGAVDDTALQERVHFVGHRDGLKGALTVRENLALAPALLGSPGLGVAEAAERLALLPLLDLPTAVLSAGQRRRAALARLLTAARPVWLLDEPTAALDASSSDIVASLIAEHAAGGGIILAATHLPLGRGMRELTFLADGGFALREPAR